MYIFTKKKVQKMTCTLLSKKKKQGRTVVYRSLDLHVVILMTIGFSCTFLIRSDSLYLENTCTSYKNDYGVL